MNTGSVMTEEEEGTMGFGSEEFEAAESSTHARHSRTGAPMGKPVREVVPFSRIAEDFEESMDPGHTLVGLRVEIFRT